MSTLDPYVVTFNCGRKAVNPSIFSTHLFSALTTTAPPDILILCLQEIAPIAYSFLGGSYLVPYLSPFRHAVTAAAASLDDAKYVNIITRNIGMTAIMVFVLRDQTAQVQWLETAEVGVGFYEMGNKGAVGVRLGYAIGDSTVEFTFVSAHLAPMEDKVQRRNKDWSNIVRGLVFTPVSLTAVRKNTAQRLPHESSNDTEPLLQAPSPGGDSIPPMSGLYAPTSHLIVAGDLNYRTSSTKPKPDAHVTWPQPSSDEDSKQHYSHLLPSDQLQHEMRAGKTCHGLQEAPIAFPPTYKYSDEARSTAASRQNDGDGDESHWDWAKHRWPSWCDRVLYLDMPPWVKSKDPAARVEVRGYKALPLMASSDHRPVACSFSVLAEAISEPNEDEEDGDAKPDVRLVPPFGPNPLWMEQREAARTKEAIVGIAAFLVLTWEGRGILFAVVIGALGGWAAIRSFS